MGNDLLLRALPAQPVQVAHAVAASGYEFVVPISWGEELVAEAALQRLAHQGSSAGPQVFCCCPRVRARLLAPGHELASHLLSLVAPPVALARYLREHTPGLDLRITYIGACDGGRDPAIDRQVHPADFLRELAALGIALAAQPTTFSDVIPPDRRRHWSLPGGCPSPESVREHTALDDVTFLPGPEVAHDIVDAILRREPVLLDVAAPLSCACAGAIAIGGVTGSRQAIVSREPPRAQTPIIEAAQLDELEHRITTPASYTSSPPLDVNDVVPSLIGAPAPAAARTFSGEGGTGVADQAPELAEGTVLATHTLPTRRRIAVTPPGVAVHAAQEESTEMPLPAPEEGAEDKPSTAAPSAPVPGVASPTVASHTERRRWLRRHGAAPRVTPPGAAPIPRAFAALRDRHAMPTAPTPAVTEPSAEAGARPESPPPADPSTLVAPEPVRKTPPVVTVATREPPATHTVGAVPPPSSDPARHTPKVVRPTERSRPWPTILLVVVMVVLAWVIMRTLWS